MNHKKGIRFYSIVLIGLVIFPMVLLINSNTYTKNNPLFENDDHIILKPSNIILYSVYIDDLPGSTKNWSWAKSQNYCHGYGNSTHPYIIENKTFMTNTSGNCFKIYNSEVYFIIKNCTFKNSDSSSYGILLENVSNGLILNNTIKDNYRGIKFDSSNDNQIFNNTIKNNNDGIEFETSEDNKIFNNTILNNTDSGFILFYSNNNTIMHNNFISNRDGLYITYSNNFSISNNTFDLNSESGIMLSDSFNISILNNKFNKNFQSAIEIWDASSLISGNEMLNNGIIFNINNFNMVNSNNEIHLNNTVNGKSVCFYQNKTNLKNGNFTKNGIPGQIILINCSNTEIKDLEFSNTSHGIALYYSNNSLITNNTISNININGIDLYESENATIVENLIEDCDNAGIALDGSSHFSNISRNEINNCSGVGISTEYSNNILICNNTLKFNTKGIHISDVINLNLSNNNASKNIFGIEVFTTENCIITDNICNNNSVWGFVLACNEMLLSNNTANYNQQIGFIFSGFANSIISYNTLKGNKFHGMSVGNCENVTFERNNLTNCGFDLWCDPIWYSSINISTTNKVNGNPIYYFYDKIDLSTSNFTKDGNPGQIILANCSKSKIDGLTITENTIGIGLYYSNNNSISNNNISNNLYVGIYLRNSQSNNITGNSIYGNENCGIHLFVDSHYNNISDNTIEKNEYGLNITYNSNNNTISFNSFIDNQIHYHIENSTVGNNLFNNTFITNEPSEPPDDNPDEIPDEIVIVITVVSITVASTAGVSSIIIYNVQKSAKYSIKITKKVGSKAIKSTKKPKIKKKTGKKITKKVKPSLKPSKEILKELSNKEELLKLLEEGVKVSDQKLTLVSDNLLCGIDKLSFTEIQKQEFLREMLAFTPLERADILTGMLEGATFGIVVPAIPKKEKKVDLEHVLVHEEKTLDIIQKYIEKHKKFEINEIIPFLISRFARASINININGINEIVKSLIEKNLIVEGSILVKNEILNNNNRKNIFEKIQEQPGIHLNKLAKKLDLSTAVIRWHVKILEKFNCIRKEIIGNHYAFFDLAKNPANDQLLHFISREKIQKIIQYMELNDEGCLLTEISKELGMHYNTVKKYIKKLEDFNLVFHKKDKIYYINKKINNSLKK